MRSRGIGVGAASLAAATCAIVVAGCGGSSGGPVTLNLLGPLDPGGTNTKAAKECSEQSGGKYVIKQTPVANSADASRELSSAASRPATRTSTSSTWTRSGLRSSRRPDGCASSRAPRRRTRSTTCSTARRRPCTWKDKTYGDPAEHQRPAALVPQGPRPQAARDLGRDDRDGQEAAAPARATSSSRARSTRATSCGSTTSSPPRAERSSTPRAGRRSATPAVKAAQIIKDVATSGRVRPVAVDRAGGPGAARVRGRQGRLPAQLAVRLRLRARRTPRPATVTKKVFENMGYARWPGVNKGEPSKVSIGGANLGIPKTGRNPELATKAALCMTSAKWQAAGGHQRGPPAGHERDLRRRRRSARSTRSPTCCASSCKDSVVRPATPSYSDVTLAIQDSLHPPAGIDPQKSINTLSDRLQHPRRRRDVLMAVAAQPPRRQRRPGGALRPDRPREGRAQARLHAVRARRCS